MSADFGVPDPVVGAAGSVLGAILGKARPKLRVWVAGVRSGGDALEIYVRAGNEGDAAVTVSTLSSWVIGRGRHEIREVEFHTGPDIPFRLESYGFAEWRATFRATEPWMRRKVKCTAFIAGAGGKFTASNSHRVRGR